VEGILTITQNDEGEGVSIIVQSRKIIETGAKEKITGGNIVIG